MDEDMLKKKGEVLKQIAEQKVNILTPSETLDILLETKKSIARFGDGELRIIFGSEVGFQDQDVALGKRLKEVLCTKQDFCLIGIPNELNDIEGRKEKATNFWINSLYLNRKQWLSLLDENRIYYSTNITRPYIDYLDTSNVGPYFERIKKLWDNENVIICEGKLTRLGVGNDLLDNCKSVRRVLCPPRNAFDKYDDILYTLKKYPKDVLIILALGPTATVLAYDLAKEGYRALDVGHVDIEYEWFLRKAVIKEPIENKYVNEAPDGRNVGELRDEKYEKQIDIIVD